MQVALRQQLRLAGARACGHFERAIDRVPNGALSGVRRPPVRRLRIWPLVAHSPASGPGQAKRCVQPSQAIEAPRRRAGAAPRRLRRRCAAMPWRSSRNSVEGVAASAPARCAPGSDGSRAVARPCPCPARRRPVRDGGAGAARGGVEGAVGRPCPGTSPAAYSRSGRQPRRLAIQERRDQIAGGRSAAPEL